MNKRLSEMAKNADEALEPVAWIQQDRGNTVVVWRENPKKFEVGTKFYADPVPAKRCCECNGLGTSDGRDGALIPCFACGGKGVIAPKADGWQPIQTAPKDGTEFLGYNAESERMYLIERVHIEYSNETTWCDRSGYYGIHLTHWMPLPAAPASGVTGQSSPNL